MSRLILCSYILTLVLSFVICQRDKNCDPGYECIPNSDCDSYQEKRNKLDTLERKTQEFNDLLSEMRQLVCNRRRKRICCEVEAPQPPVTLVQRDNSDESSPSYVPSGNNCGVAVKSAAFIVGGNDTELGEFPWMVLLGKDKPTGDIIWHCGGTLINKWYVLTAAHCNRVDFVRLGEWKVVDTNTFNKQECLYYDERTEKQCKDFRRCGRRWCQKKNNADVDCESPTVCSDPHQDIRVAKSLTNPQYKKTIHGLAINDIMLLKLESPAQFNKYVSPICLPDISLTDRLGEDGHNSLNNGFGLVVGWGKTQTSIDDEISIVSTATQQKVDLPLLSITKCVDKYKGIGVDLTQDIRLDEHLCAGGVRGIDSCSGDSGGPLIARESDLDSYMIIGVVSGGTKRCGIGAPGTFTRVSNYRQWIIDNLK